MAATASAAVASSGSTNGDAVIRAPSSQDEPAQVAELTRHETDEYLGEVVAHLALLIHPERLTRPETLDRLGRPESPLRFRGIPVESAAPRVKNLAFQASRQTFVEPPGQTGMMRQAQMDEFMGQGMEILPA